MISEALRADMEAKGIDLALTDAILADLNAGLYDGVQAVEASGVPPVDGVSLVPAGAAMSYRAPVAAARERLAAFGLGLPVGAVIDGGAVSLDRAALVDLGERLYPATAWGVLNGGSATSYADRKKNGSLGPGVFDVVRSGFELLAPLCDGRPKGVSPAYVNPDGSPGESFLVLKMRAALLRAARYVERFGTPDFMRLRFGIGRPNHDDVAGYVLSDFSRDEREKLECSVFPRAATALSICMERGFDEALASYAKSNALA